MNRHERRAAAKHGKPDMHAATHNGAAAIYNAVIAEMRAGRYLDAQMRCRQALASSPEDPEILHLTALVCFNAKQFDHAVEWASRAIRTDPKPAYLTTLGTALLNLAKHDDALKVFEKAVQLEPDDAGLWSNFGEALVLAGRGPDAVACFKRAFEIDPDCWNAAYKAGGLLREQGQFEESLASLNACNRLQPNHALTLALRARVFHDLRRFEEALADSRRAQVLDPTNAYNDNNLGEALRKLDRPQEALPWFDKALELLPDLVEALNNKAFSLTSLHRFDEAIAVLQRSVAVDPDRAATVWNLALIQLLTGSFVAGWAGREARWRNPELSAVANYLKLSTPIWQGEESIAGKTIVIGADEGLGDVVQFARYVPMLAARGAQVVLVVDKALCPLLAELPGVSICLPKQADTVLPPFDFHCPVTSLPAAFGTELESIPSANYLPPISGERVAAWQDKLGPHDRLRVGLIWSGNPRHQNDRNRSIPLRLMTGILDVDATFVSLQKDPRPDDKAALADSQMLDQTVLLTDFAETAALLSCLDLVITVDTSVAHLAGALGRPSWILLPYVPDWRWLLDRDDSPWYPTVRLFRQTETREYGSVLTRVRTELAAQALAHSHH
jgi:tetratricopeptide (TPR) repeat protein